MFPSYSIQCLRALVYHTDYGPVSPDNHHFTIPWALFEAVQYVRVCSIGEGEKKEGCRFSYSYFRGEVECLLDSSTSSRRSGESFMSYREQ